MDFRKDINGLRAIAVLLVLLFHFGAAGFGGGFIGVDVFFVISGFLMTNIISAGIDKGSFSIFGFYRARLARLYPALLAVVAATLLFGLFMIEPGALKQIARDGVSALLFVSNMLFWRQAGYFGAPADSMWFLHTWSLSVEWQFYLIYPVVLVIAFPLLPGRAARFGLLAAGFVLSLALSVMAGEAFANTSIVSAGFYTLPTRAWEMLAGGLVALWPPRQATGAPRLALLSEVAGLVLVGIAVAIFSGETTWPSWNALLPTAGTMLVLLARNPRSVVAFAPLQRIGDWSYSIYLWHWPLVAGMAYFGIAGGASKAAAFALSVLAGWASYRFIEQPCRRALKSPSQKPSMPGRRFTPLAGPLAGLMACAVATMAASAVVMAANGFPQRNEAVAAVYRQSLDADADYRFPFHLCGGTTTFGKSLRPCELGQPSAGSDVLIIGDSFAEIWHARVEKLSPDLTDRAVVFVTKGGCPPLKGLRRTAAGFGCEAFHEMGMKLAKGERFGTVIYIGMWASYFQIGAHNAVICNNGGTCVSAGTPAGLSLAISNFGEEVDELRAQGKKVVILTTGPYPHFDVPSELRRLAFHGGPAPADWSFDFSTVLARSEPVDAGLMTLAAHGATVIDLPSLLCKNLICPLLREGAPLYTDESHLRSDYTEVMGSFLDPFLRDREIRSPDVHSAL